MAVNFSFNASDEEFTTRGTVDRQRNCVGGLVKVHPEDQSVRSSSSSSFFRRLSPRRCSDGVLKVDSLKQTSAASNTSSSVHRNVSYPRVQDRHHIVTNQSALPTFTGGFRQQILQNTSNSSSLLKKRVQQSEDCCSDSEVSLKTKDCVDQLKHNRSFHGERENRNPEHFSPVRIKTSNRINATNKQGRSQIGINPGAHWKIPTKSASGSSANKENTRSSLQQDLSIPQPLDTTKLSIDLNQRFSGSESSIHTRTDSPVLLSAASPKSKSRSVGDSPEKEHKSDFKRSKSLFNKSPTSRKHSPVTARRKSPYKELEVSKKSIESEKASAVYHLPPKSPLIINTSENGDSVFSNALKNKRKKTFQSQYKSSSSHRKQRHSAGWIPVQEMMTNLQYEGHYHDDSSGEDGGCCETDDARMPRMKRFDAVIFDVLKVSPEEFARQLTILDFPIFASITPDEITSCGWTKKDKLEHSPNVCLMTQRFNNTSFWVIREILHASTLKIRAEILTHFIKIAKKLYELNNLHSLMAVVQSLNSSSIIRLSKTWALIQKNHKATFDRLLTLVSEDDNRWELRSHMEDIKLPCIPFIGMYLSDVMYINTAHPHTGGLESHERTNKMNNILRVIAEFQQSKYDHLQEKPHIKNYLNSHKYIEELLKFLEEDNYKLSLKIEPSQSTTSYQTPEKKSHRPKDDTSAGKSNCKTENHLYSHYMPTPPSQQRFVPGHRKTRSLGREFAFAGAVTMRPKSDSSKVQKSGSLPRTAGPSSAAVVTTSLLDDSIIATPSSLASSSSSHAKMSVAGANSGSIESSRSNSGSEFSEHDELSVSSDKALKYQTFPRKKSKTSTKWFKVYHGNRGKYSLRASKAQEDKRKSSTIPAERNTVFPALRHPFITSHRRLSVDAEDMSAGSSSTISEIDEFAKMRSQTEQQPKTTELRQHDVIKRDETETTGYVKNIDYEVEMERASLISIDSLSRKERYRSPTRIKSDASDISETNVRSATSLTTCSSDIFVSSDATKFVKQYFVSPKLSRSQHSYRNEAKNTHKTTMDGVYSQLSIATSYKVHNPKNTIKEETMTELNSPSSSDINIRTLDISSDDFQTCKFEGCLKRKCVLKHGKKPTMSPWTKYWVCICDTKLVYFAAKSLRGHERHHFKSRPCKAVSILGWMLLFSNDPSRLDCFQLNNTESGNMYRFQCDSKEVALVWIANLQEAIKVADQPERDLINLDDS